MNLTIDRLTLVNFKGIPSLDISLDGRSAAIFGANATGKTTVMDAWLWLLFGKDSTNRTTFTVKPQDSSGDEIHHLETVVEADITVDSRRHTVRKTLSEKWVTRRGFDVAEFTGNETAYMIDGVPRKASEWSAWVSELANEDVFRLLSNPLHFNTALSWQERRKVLFEMIEPLDDRVVAAANTKYDRISELLDKHSIEDAQKAVAYQIKELNKEREGITPRIDELTRSIADIEPSAIDLARAGIADLQIKLDMIDREVEDVQAAARRMNDAYRMIGELERVKAEKQRHAEMAANKERDDALRELDAARSVYARAERNLASVAAQRADCEARIANLERDIAAKRAEYNARAAQAYEAADGDDNCPMCRQLLPEDIRAGNDAERRAAWQRAKERDLAAITAEGKRMQGQLSALKEDMGGFAMREEAERETARASSARIEELSPWESTAVSIPAVDTSEEDAAIAALQAEAKSATAVDTSALRARRTPIMAEMQELQAVVARAAQAGEARARIEELGGKERSIGEKLTELDGQRYLLEQLVADKCSMLEGRINALFPTVRWKLFDVAINGGVKDCCECMIGGVPFPDANNAARINAGLEIIERLCARTGARVPIFIDNAESVNRLSPTGSQTVSLLVSLDRELRVEMTAATQVA